MKVYSLAKGWLIFILIGGGAVVLASTYALLFIYVKGIIDYPSVTNNWVLASMFLIVILFLIYTMVQAFKSKLFIEEDRLRLMGASETRELLFTDVRGFRSDNKYIYLFPLSDTSKTMRIRMYYEDSSGLLAWLSGKFKDLDKTEREEEEKQILENADLGQSTEERSHAFAKAKKTVQIASIVGVVIAVSLFVADEFLRCTIVAAAIYPLFIVVLLKSSKGLIRVSGGKNSPYPSIAIGLLAPVFGLFTKCLASYHILSNSGVWQPAGVIAGMLFILLFIKSKELEKLGIQISVLLLLYAGTCFAYGYSVIIGYNCVYDTSQSIRYEAKVLDKRIVSGKSKSYYLLLSPWGPVNIDKEISVSRNLYNNSQIDDNVYIYLYSGKLNVPWYIVESE